MKPVVIIQKGSKQYIEEDPKESKLLEKSALSIKTIKRSIPFKKQENSVNFAYSQVNKTREHPNKFKNVRFVDSCLDKLELVNDHPVSKTNEIVNPIKKLILYDKSPPNSYTPSKEQNIITIQRKPSIKITANKEQESNLKYFPELPRTKENLFEISEQQEESEIINPFLISSTSTTPIFKESNLNSIENHQKSLSRTSMDQEVLGNILESKETVVSQEV
jgi:hypothetical protein